MLDFLTKIPEPVRAWFYRASLASIGLAVALNRLDQETAAAWAVWLGVVLGGGSSLLASVNTSTKS